MPDRMYRVRPWAGGWGVFVVEPSGTKPSPAGRGVPPTERNVTVDPLRTAADAVAHAKQLAKRVPGGAQISVYDEDDALLSEFFYQPAERASLERDDEIPSMAASRPSRRKTRPPA
jgi:hypothetical protein